MGIEVKVPIEEWVRVDWSSRNIQKEGTEEDEATFKCNLKVVKRWDLFTVLVGEHPGLQYLKPEKFMATAVLEVRKDSAEEYEKCRLRTGEESRREQLGF